MEAGMIPRKHPRVIAQFPARFAGDHDGEGLVINLSRDGCCIAKSNVQVQMKAVLTVHLFVSFQEPAIKVDAAVARWSASYSFGLKFLVMNENEQQHLERYLQQTAVKPPLDDVAETR